MIRRGWDWLGILPTAPERVTGIVEVPSLSQSLTLNKGDFVRTGPRGAVYLSYRRAIQEAVQAQLTRWGDARDVAQDERRRIARPLERDLERVLEGLTGEFPLLSSLVERQRGAQRRIALADGGRASGSGGPVVLVSDDAARAAPAADEALPGTPSPPDALAGTGLSLGAPPPAAPTEPDAPAQASDASGDGPAGVRLVRPQRYGLALQFEPRAGDPELARLIENTVYINTVHPAYVRAESTRSTGYHVAVAVALALAPLATGGTGVQQFLTVFLAQWGEAVQSRPKSKPGPRPRGR